MKHIHEIIEDGFSWVNVSKQGENELNEIQHRFRLHSEDIKESLPPFQRPKIVKRSDYYFVVLQFPVFDRGTRRLGFTEVDIFLNANYLITIHDNRLPIINSFFNECQANLDMRGEYFSGTMAHVLLELLNRLFESIFPILLHINEDINTVDTKLFTTIPDREMASEILRLKTNIVTFRRTMQGHRTVLDRLVMNGDHDLQLVSFQHYINSLREAVAEVWHMIESQKESIDALHETNESMLSLRTNEVMKTLTIISVITFPLTLIATIFAMRARGTPFIDEAYGFWIVSGLTLIGAVLMFAVFKRKKWM
jgi:magnesium transporter